MPTASPPTLRSDTAPVTREDGAWAVTGASGYLGGRLVRELRARGRRVVALGRRPPADRAAEHRAFELGAAPPAGALDGVVVLVHAAYDFTAARPGDVRRVNVDGSLRLFDDAARRGVRIAHVSSLSAFPGCRSLYGQAKLAVEEATAQRAGAVVRPGLIYGRDAGGMVGAMAAAVRALPAVPLVGSGAWVQFTGHVADVARLVLHAASAAPGPGVLVAASERPCTLREIVEVLARASGRRRLLVPVPVPVLFAAIRAAELARVPLRTRSDSLVGLLHGNAAPDFGPTRATGIAFRPFDETTVGQDA